MKKARHQYPIPHTTFSYNNLKDLPYIAKLRLALHKKRSFPLKTSLVNVTKSTGGCGFGRIY